MGAVFGVEINKGLPCKRGHCIDLYRRCGGANLEELDLTKQGYITLALGHPRYYEMALNLALSLKWKDPIRPVCLVHDGALPSGVYEDIFDNLVEMPPDSAFQGCANKLRLDQFSPYEETFYIDSDCLVVKADMDRHWNKFAGHAFNLAGDMASAGKWYDFDIAQVCEELAMPYIVRMNSGVMFFQKNAKAEELFKTARSLTNTAGSAIGCIHQGVAGQYADEPFFGVAMGQLGLRPITYTPEEGSLMITTWLAKGCAAELAGDISVLKKPDAHWLLNRFFAKSYTSHSPTIMHFISLKPKMLYTKLVAELHEKFNGEYKLPKGLL